MQEEQPQAEPFLLKTAKIFKSKLSKKTHEVVGILQSLLHLNPYFRMTAAECLRNTVFDPVRDHEKEKILI